MRLVARERVKDNRFDGYQDMFLCLEIFQLMVQVILYAVQLGLWQLTMLQELLVKMHQINYHHSQLYECR